MQDPNTTVIQELRFEAGCAGDTAMVSDCNAALDGDKAALQRVKDALARARAMEDPEPEPNDDVFDALWYGEHDGEAFDGDPADIW